MIWLYSFFCCFSLFFLLCAQFLGIHFQILKISQYFNTRYSFIIFLTKIPKQSKTTSMPHSTTINSIKLFLFQPLGKLTSDLPKMKEQQNLKQKFGALVLNYDLTIKYSGFCTVSINFVERKEEKKAYCIFSFILFLVMETKKTPVDKVFSLGDPGSFLVFHNYFEQATVFVAVSFLSNEINGTAFLRKHIVGINPLLQLVHCCRLLSSTEHRHAKTKLKLAFALVEIISIYQQLLLEAFPLQSFFAQHSALMLK